MNKLARMTATCHEMLRQLLKTRMSDSCSNAHGTDPVLLASEDILHEHENAYTEHLSFFSNRTVVTEVQDASVSSSYCLSPSGPQIESPKSDGSPSVVFKTSQQVVELRTCARASSLPVSACLRLCAVPEIFNLLGK